MEPDWVEHAIWWQVHPLSFVGAESDSAGVALTHRLGRIVDWFDYAVELGASGVALGPVFASGTHGYDTIDHFRIDPRLGDDADFRALVAAAHDRGLRVLLDGVFNHVGREFPAFVAAEAGGPEAAWFRRADDGGWATFEGHDMLVALNHDEPAVADHVVAVMGHWLAAGADGWRLDAAYAVPPAFWARVLPRVRERFPDVYVVGEVIHGDYADIVEASGMDAVTQYELWKAIWNAIEERNLFELDHALGRHNDMLDDVRAADVRRQPRRHPHRQRHRRRAAPAARAGHAVHRGGHPVGVLRRRAGVPRDQGGTRGRRRRHPPAVPREPGRPLAARGGHLPAAPGTDRAAPPPPLAAPGGHHDAAPDQHGVASTRSRRTASGWSRR